MRKTIIRLVIFFLFGFILAPSLLFAADPPKDPFYTQGVQLFCVSGVSPETGPIRGRKQP